jgi:hypothetical protein
LGRRSAQREVALNNPTISRVRTKKNTLPSLFGRLTTVWADHGELTALLPKLDVMCDLIDSGQTVLPATVEPSRLIQSLRLRFRGHFESEEDSGYFSHIARERPELLPTVVALKADHAAMLRKLDELAWLADEVPSWGELSRRARALRTFLCDHERAESELMHCYLAGDERAS